MKFFTYIYRDPSRANEPIYVGKGTKRRALGHAKREDRHPFVQRLQKMERNGIKPSIELIEALDEDHAFFLEECLVSLLGRKDLGTGTLLNLTEGGRGPRGLKWSDASKQKLSNAQRGRVLPDEWKQKIGKAMTGKPQSAEKGAKISAAKLGVKNSSEHNAALSKALKGKPWTAERRAAQERRKCLGT